MLPDKTHTIRTYIENYLENQQIIPGHILDVNSTDLLLDFTKIGLGIGCVMKELVQSELDNHMLTELILPTKPKKQRIGFVYQKTHLQSGSVNKFIDFYKGGCQ